MKHGNIILQCRLIVRIVDKNFIHKARYSHPASYKFHFNLNATNNQTNQDNELISDFSIENEEKT